MSIIKYALILLVVLIGLAFHVRNGQLVAVDYYLGSSEIPLSMALAVALFGGAILGVLSGLPAWLKLKRDKAKLNKQLKACQTDNSPDTQLSTDKD